MHSVHNDTTPETRDWKEIVSKELKDLAMMVDYLKHHPVSVQNAAITHPVEEALTEINARLEAMVTVVRSASEWEFRSIEARRPGVHRL